MEALDLARAEGLSAKLLVPKLLYPVAEEVYADFLRSARCGMVIEQSHQGQLFRLIRMFVDVPPAVESLARSGANPIAPGEIVDRVRAMLAARGRRAPEMEPHLD
jgi:2-oxoglutarate ferredoxin oxidoreductase subunit alpha